MTMIGLKGTDTINRVKRVVSNINIHRSQPENALTKKEHVHGSRRNKSVGCTKED